MARTTAVTANATVPVKQQDVPRTLRRVIAWRVPLPLTPHLHVTVRVINAVEISLALENSVPIKTQPASVRATRSVVMVVPKIVLVQTSTVTVLAIAIIVPVDDK